MMVGGAWAQSALEVQVLNLVNQQRLADGLAPLRWSERAYKAALAHGEDMLQQGYFGHVNPEGVTPGEWLVRAGILAYETGENLALFEHLPLQDVPQRTVQGWMGSPPHRANLLRPDFTATGIAILLRQEEALVVEEFVAEPFSLHLRVLPASAPVVLADLQGSPPSSLGLFVGPFLYQVLPPTFHVRLYLPPGTLRYGLQQGGSWYSVQPGQGVELRAQLVRLQAPGLRLELTLPAGRYLLALGNPPHPWQAVEGPRVLVLTLPGLLGPLWVGSLEGNQVRYAYRVPLVDFTATSWSE